MNDEPTGKAIGGHARAEILSPEERRAIAKKAATTRWGLKATHKGNFKDEFGIDVECYVLDDEQKTAVISQRGMAPALGLSGGSGGRLPSFVNSATMAPILGRELVEKIRKPLVFQWRAPVPTKPMVTINGYDVTILIDICKAVIQAEADGKLKKIHQNVAKQAHIILGASAKAGIKGLVYALAGYDATREERIAAYKMYVKEEAREYEREFPNQLYEEWYRLYELPKPKRNKPWKFKHLTIKHVYWPLANSHGKILDLMRICKEHSGDKSKKLHQFLEEIGVKALRTHLGQLLGIAQLSDDESKYESNFEKIFGRQTSFDFPE